MKAFRQATCIVSAIVIFVASFARIDPVSAQDAGVNCPYDYNIDNVISLYDKCATPITCDTTLSYLPIEQKIAQTLMVGFDASQKDSISSTAQKYQLGGIFINGKPDSSMNKEYFDGISSSLASQLIVSSDDEGGNIVRFQKNAFPFTLPTAKVMGGWDDSKITSETQTLATHLKEQGVNMVLAPVVDLDSDHTNNAISKWDRAFSTDPAVVSAKAGAFARSLSKNDLGTSLKHFPGLARTTENTDTNYQQVNANIADMVSEISPYKDIKDTKNSTIMLSNIVLSGWGYTPVSLNNSAVKFIRNDIGFTGPILTDDISVFAKYSSNPITLKDAVKRAFEAGVTMPLFTYPGDTAMDDIIKNVKETVDEGTIESAYYATIAYKQSLGLRTTKTTDPGSGGSGESGGDNLATIYNFAISQLDLTPYQAAGLTGNLQAESGGDPTATNPSGGAYGIVQWLGGRKSKLLERTGYDTLTVQMGYMKEELEGTYKMSTLDPVKASTDIKEATEIILRYYEAPCTGDGCGPELAKRLGYAEDLLKKYGDGAPSSGSGCTNPNGDAGRGDISTSATQCAPGTTFDQIIKTKYTGPEVDTPYPEIRLCKVDSIEGATVNAGVSGLFAKLGEAAKADKVSLSGSGFRLDDSCGGGGDGVGCATPGKSAHQIGLAIDFHIPGDVHPEVNSCAERTKAVGDPMYDWLFANAYSVATIKQYAREAWHWDATLKGDLRCE